MPPLLLAVHNVFNVSMLRKYDSNPSHGLSYEYLELDQDVSYIEKQVQITDRMNNVLKTRLFPS